jgi:pimeloyl-ACP methyl ester carboxylesterase
MTAQRTHELTTRDGLVVEYSLYGPPDGIPVIFHTGTPDSRWLPDWAVAAASESGVTLLVHDRPGYGGSTRRPNRTVADVATDVVQLADAVGWRRFAVLGGSGGGPHALACAALMPDQVTRCASVAGLAPFDAEDLDWYAGMSPGNVEEFTRARQGELAYRPLVERLSREAITAAEQGQPAITPEYELDAADVARLQERLGDADRVDRVRAGYGAIDGWVDDCLALIRPWGFDPATITVPTGVWYGPTDVLCPRGHAEWLLAHIPGAHRCELSGGHLLDQDDLARILRWLVSDRQV